MKITNSHLPIVSPVSLHVFKWGSRDGLYYSSQSPSSRFICLTEKFVTRTNGFGSMFGDRNEDNQFSPSDCQPSFFACIQVGESRSPILFFPEPKQSFYMPN